MKRRGTLLWVLIVFWLVAGTGFVVAAIRQKEHLNLSATAGGQMPYLVYARRVATEGLFGHFGDRNRMPLVPIVASLFYDADWNLFVGRASWVAIAVSLSLLGSMALIAYRNLTPLLATAFLLIVAVAVFAPQASFLQADVPYYAFFFCSWWAMLRLLQRPGLALASGAGLILGLTYLTKASVLLAIPIWLGMMILRAIICARRKTNESTPSDTSPTLDQVAHGNSVRWIGAGCVTLAVFLASVSPYLKNNHEHFGRFFYNVNTTFFVWCDSWTQAQRFAEKYEIDQHFPAAPPETIPGPASYWRTHTSRQIVSRLTYGLRTLGALAWESASLKYLLFLVVCAVVVTSLNPSLAMSVAQRYKWPIAWSALLFLAYVLAYAWYVVVAYGDRFVLSLVAPMLFGLCVYLNRIGSVLPASRSLPVWLSVPEQLGLMLILLALAHGIAAANTSWVTPTESFVRFYYDESHEEHRRGNVAEAERGMRGVIALDPGFAAAHRDLGMIALTQRRLDDALASLSRAAILEPTWADIQNSLGSALIQSGRLRDAIPVLERAVALKPDFAAAWYNLCGGLLQMGEEDRATACIQRLKQISPELAQNLENGFQRPASPLP